MFPPGPTRRWRRIAIGRRVRAGAGTSDARGSDAVCQCTLSRGSRGETIRPHRPMPAPRQTIRKNDPEYLDPDKVRALWSMWNCDADLLDRLTEGFVKAKARLAIAQRCNDSLLGCHSKMALAAVRTPNRVNFWNQIAFGPTVGERIAFATSGPRPLRRSTSVIGTTPPPLRASVLMSMSTHAVAGREGALLDGARPENVTWRDWLFLSVCVVALPRDPAIDP